jgi:predicted Zn-dependent protease
MTPKLVKTITVATCVVVGIGHIANTSALNLGSLVKAVRPVSEKREVKIGRGIAANLLGAAAPVDDPELQIYVNRIGKWIALQTEKPHLPWHFAILDTETVNAFAIPGGYVFITRGLLLLMRDESELAGVLAHEISHVIKRHALKTMRKGTWAKLGGEALTSGSGEDFQQVLNVGTELFSRGLDKKDEFMADYLGATLAARAGYDPYGLLAVLQTLSSVNPADDAVALMFKTHPSPEERMDRLTDFLDDKLGKYAEQAVNAERFARIMQGHMKRQQPSG